MRANANSEEKVLGGRLYIMLKIGQDPKGPRFVHRIDLINLDSFRDLSNHLSDSRKTSASMKGRTYSGFPCLQAAIDRNEKERTDFTKE